MNIHDRRKKNDWAAYRLLLTDYVGVNENGSLSNEGGAKTCLRSVLLGYLKTGEIVLGNCKSCSRCVPNGDFENDMANREKVVERLGLEITNLLDFFEDSVSDLPPMHQLHTLWMYVDQQEAAGKSLRGYVGGWTGRLLTDNPTHKTALWIRIDGMVKGFLPLQPKEVCSRAMLLLENAQFGNELNSLWNTFDLFQNVLPEMPEALEVRAVACQAMARHKEARDIWLHLLEIQQDASWENKCHSKLTELFCNEGPLPDQQLFQKHAIHAARTTRDLSQAKAFYGRAKQFWTWPDFQQELTLQVNNFGEAHGPGLISWWIDTQSQLKLLACNQPPSNWKQIIEDDIPWSEVDLTDTMMLHQSVARELNIWTTNILKSLPNLWAIRALRILILALNRTESPVELISECMLFLNEAVTDQKKWLMSIIKKGYFKREIYTEYMISAEILSREKIVNASNILSILNLIDIKYLISNFQSIKVILKRLKPKNITNNKKIFSLYLEYILKEYYNLQNKNFTKIDDWDIKFLIHTSFAELFENELITDIDFPSILFETCSNTIFIDISNEYAQSSREQILNGRTNLFFHKYAPKSIKGLIRWLNWFGCIPLSYEGLPYRLSEKLWLNLQNHIVSQTFDHIENQILKLYILEEVGSAFIETHKHEFEKILEGIDISDITKKPTLYNFLIDKINFSATNEWSIKFILHGLLFGHISDEKAINLHLAPTIFEKMDYILFTNLTKLYSAVVREQILNGNKCILFYNYNPESYQSFERWITWFGSFPAICKFAITQRDKIISNFSSTHQISQKYLNGYIKNY